MPANKASDASCVPAFPAVLHAVVVRNVIANWTFNGCRPRIVNRRVRRRVRVFDGLPALSARAQISAIRTTLFLPFVLGHICPEHLAMTSRTATIVSSSHFQKSRCAFTDASSRRARAPSRGKRQRSRAVGVLRRRAGISWPHNLARHHEHEVHDTEAHEKQHCGDEKGADHSGIT